MKIFHLAARIAALHAARALSVTISVTIGAALGACSEATDTADQPASPAVAATESAMQLRLVLDASAPASRADTATEATHAAEPVIDDVLLLLFTPDADGEPDRLYTALRGENLSEAGADGSRTFDARLGVGADTPRSLIAVAVANGARHFDALHALLPQRPDYATVSALLTESFTARQEAVAAGTAPQFTLYGRASKAVDTSLKAQSVKMRLLRDLARVTLTLADDVYARGHRLSSLHFYNRFDGISLFPHRYEAGRASLPAGTAAVANADPTPRLTDAPALTIYTSEQDVLLSGTGDPDDDSRFIRPALIVGVYYRGTELSYYRLDLKDSEGRLYDILRNHSYNIHVTGIDGPGQSTPEEAYFNITTSIAAEIIPWDDVEFDAGFDGGSWVALSREVTLGPSAGDAATLTVATNVPVDTWELAWAAPGDDVDGLTYVTAATLAGDLFEVTLPAELDAEGRSALAFKALANLPSDLTTRSRTLYVNVTPRLRLAISVTQSQSSADGSDAPWGSDYIFGYL